MISRNRAGRAQRLLLTCCLLNLFYAAGGYASADAPALPPLLPAPGTGAGFAWQTEQTAAGNTATPAANTLAGLTMTLAEMGQKAGLTLSGTQLQSGVMFTLPRDLVVTGAKISLALQVSPELAATDASVQLMLNGQPLGSLPLGQDANDNGVFQMDIPASIMVAVNNLSFRIHRGADGAGGQGQCEKALPDNYRLTILPTSAFQLSGLRLDSGRRLDNLPRPFFDPSLMAQARLPVAFALRPTADVIGAAATVASWFGAQAGFRDADFPVLLNALPEENGIIFGKPGDNIGDLVMPGGGGAQLRIIDNPRNPVYKLLLISGSNESELRQAAWRLVSAPLPAADALRVQAQDIPRRQPYDAPRWISTRRPTSLALNEGPEHLAVKGGYHGAIPVSFRAAPDLFMWDDQTIAVDLFYHFPTGSWLDETQSHLSVAMNGVFVRNLPVNKTGPIAALMRYAGYDTRQEHATLQLDPYLIYGDNQLAFYFAVNPAVDAPCGVLDNDNIRSRIEPASTIDLSHAYHFAQLPNLSYYVGASFPFTRRADFADTLLLLPDNPGSVDIQTLLGLAARAGNATGVAIGHVSVALGAGVDETQAQSFRDKDILAVGSLAHEEFIRRLLAGSPFTAAGAALGVARPHWQQQLASYLAGNWFPQFVQANRYLSSMYSWRGFVSFRSGQNPGRIVILATATDDDQLAKIHGDLQSPYINSRVRGDIAIVTNERDIQSFQVGPQFAAGDLPWHLQLLWHAGRHLLALSLLGLALALLLGARCYANLKNHAARRLGTGPDHE
ncbi:cellulose biosynthesis cyclic di-GMP-binding regulatory protein BcsB [Acerihabitans arboris]|uniref:Cyclic di-GMP-binding protein n=1 Tax=Acerihabitans arboris TaxID=2691583 RepID=A0A845SE62_9GAMM|nr:cellulose biosynthesis cyclic di-GMP-binding regulatory protein BcsB [Acerihabitans arboris]NDL61692.1 cellulose biosynthesis cyclic di-GMP-binding regulatory protein BcsB [Acerihabitans arboris]